MLPFLPAGAAGALSLGGGCSSRAAPSGGCLLPFASLLEVGTGRNHRHLCALLNSHLGSQVWRGCVGGSKAGIFPRRAGRRPTGGWELLSQRHPENCLDALCAHRELPAAVPQHCPGSPGCEQRLQGWLFPFLARLRVSGEQRPPLPAAARRPRGRARRTADTQRQDGAPQPRSFAARIGAAARGWGRGLDPPPSAPRDAGAAALGAERSALRQQAQSQVFGGVTYYNPVQQQVQPKPSPPRRTSQPVTIKPPPPEVPPLAPLLVPFPVPSARLPAAVP